jgi:DNA-binding NtrC family response regulator
MGLSQEALEVLTRHSWPGNVRELKNVLEAVVIFHPGGEIRLGDLPPELKQAATVSTPGAPVQAPAGTPRSMADIERQAILETLERTGGHRARAAEILDIGLRTLQRKLKEYKDDGYLEE